MRNMTNQELKALRTLVRYADDKMPDWGAHDVPTVLREPYMAKLILRKYLAEATTPTARDLIEG